MPGRVYNVLHTFALNQGGYLTIRQAHGLGVPTDRLEVLKQRGTFEQASRRVCRFPDVTRDVVAR
jgi:hypothetical protein